MIDIEKQVDIQLISEIQIKLSLASISIHQFTHRSEQTKMIKNKNEIKLLKMVHINKHMASPFMFFLTCLTQCLQAFQRLSKITLRLFSSCVLGTSVTFECGVYRKQIQKYSIITLYKSSLFGNKICFTFSIILYQQ